MRTAAALLCAGLAAVACTARDDVASPGGPEPTTTVAAPSEPAQVGEPDDSDSKVAPVFHGDFRSAAALAAVRHLAGSIGPRLATGPAYRRAADWVAGELRALGYDVRRQQVAVPAGDSWGEPVEAGRSWNVVAAPAGFESSRPHLVVGAHLDTVAVSPGAEDNASGVGVLLAAAAAVAEHRTRLPVVFVAFGAEEPRGDTDADHHYGSRTYVAGLTAAERKALRGMVSLDRVGVGQVVPIGSARTGRDRLAERLERAAATAGVPTVREANRSSDHWQFVLAGLPGARLGSTPYAGYHSAGDVPVVVDRSQLQRVGRLLLQWLAP